MTTPEGTVRAWGARAWIAVTIHIPHLDETDVKAAVTARLAGAEAACVEALTAGIPTAYIRQPEHAITVTALHFDNTGSSS